MKKIISLFFILCSISMQAQIRMCAEWESAIGTLIRWPLGIPYELVVELAEEDMLFVLVIDVEEENSATSSFIAHNVNIENCQFIYAATNTHWTRDWGPQNIFTENGEWAILDPIFDGYPWVPGGRPYEDDDLVNEQLAEYFNCQNIEFPAYLTGGNIMTDGLGNAYSTQQMLNENLSIMTEQEFFDYSLTIAGIENYYIYHNIENYGIQHIDCGAKLLNEETVLIKRLPQWHPEYDRMENLYNDFASSTTCFDRPFRIIRIDCEPYNGSECAAYTNSLILNKKVLVPLFGIDADEEAIETYQQAMPGYEVIGIEYNEWYYYDALHCRTREIVDRFMIHMVHRNLDYEYPEDEPIIIEATIDDRSEAGLIDDQLLVGWKTVENTEFDFVQLLPTINQDSYQAIIPHQEVGSIVEYYITASDNTGRTLTLPRTAPDNLFSFSITESINNYDDEINLTEFNLNNYPNPFNPSTTIEFSILNESKVDLYIFNIKGQKVKTLTNGIYEKGNHSIIWNGDDESDKSVDSGIYLYKLKVNGKTEAVNKCILLK